MGVALEEGTVEEPAWGRAAGITNAKAPGWGGSWHTCGIEQSTVVSSGGNRWAQEGFMGYGKEC